MNRANIVDITPDNFQQVIIEGSREKLIAVYFWAAGYQPCEQLNPVLEKIAGDYPDQLILAKINCEQQQQLAMQFGVQSLPTVALFKDGQPVDGFAGVEAESQIRSRFEEHLPSATDDLVKQVEQALETEDYEQAYTLAKQAYDLNSEDVEFA